jgi:glycosyltransferase involved in cell wall biosynthesis
MVVYEDEDYDPGFMGGYLRQLLTARLEHFLVRRVHLVISVGHRLAALRRRQTGRKPYVVHNGVASRVFEPARQKVSHPPTLVFVGNIIPADGLELTMQALPAIRKQIAQIRLLVVADGAPAYRQRLRRLVAAQGLDDMVQFLGPQPHHTLPHVFRQADIGLAHFQPVPYRVFCFPLKVLEYMVAGLPVIGTVGTESGDLIQRCACGHAIPFTEAALVEAVCSLFTEPEQYDRYRTNAIKHSREFDWQTIFDQEYDLIASHSVRVLG